MWRVGHGRRVKFSNKFRRGFRPGRRVMIAGHRSDLEFFSRVPSTADSIESTGSTTVDYVFEEVSRERRFRVTTTDAE